MASETGSGSAERSSFIESLLNPRNSNFSLFLPLISGLNPINPPQETENRETAENGEPARESGGRIILINPFAQTMVVIESSSRSSPLGFDSLLDELLSRKSGRPPASKASIDALQSVEIEVNDGDEQCVVCLEEWETGEKAKEMPCKHKFHGECIEKWLKIHGSCPVCRYEMPVDEADDEKKRGDGERRRGIWMEFSFNSERRSREDYQSTLSSGSSQTSDS